jgi:hypothetical protein
MTYSRACDKNNMTDATTGAGTVYPSRAPKFAPCFYISDIANKGQDVTRRSFVVGDTSSPEYIVPSVTSLYR